MNFEEKKIWNLLRNIDKKIEAFSKKDTKTDNSGIEKRLSRIESDLTMIKNKLKK